MKVERAGFRGYDMSLIDPSEHERAKAAAVDDRVHRAADRDDETVGAFDLLEGIADLAFDRRRFRSRAIRWTSTSSRSRMRKSPLCLPTPV